MLQLQEWVAVLDDGDRPARQHVRLPAFHKGCDAVCARETSDGGGAQSQAAAVVLAAAPGGSSNAAGDTVAHSVAPTGGPVAADATLDPGTVAAAYGTNTEGSGIGDGATAGRTAAREQERQGSDGAIDAAVYAAAMPRRERLPGGMWRARVRPTREPNVVRQLQLLQHDSDMHAVVCTRCDPWLAATDSWLQEPTTSSGRAVPQPYRGVQVLSIVLRGALRLADEAGHGVVLQRGEAVALNAGAGAFQQVNVVAGDGRHGRLLQLWLNVPAANRTTQPHRHVITRDDMPTLSTPDGWLRVLAGEAPGTQQRGPLATASQVQVVEVFVRAGGVLQVAIPPAHRGWYYVVAGRGVVGGAAVRPHTVTWLSDDGGAGGAATLARIQVAAARNTSAPLHLYMCTGVPLREPVAVRGGIVGSTHEEVDSVMRTWPPSATVQ